MQKWSSEKILKLANELIPNNDKVVFVQDFYELAGLSSSTFYRYIPSDSEDYKQIQDLIEPNRTQLKREIRDRLLECKNPTALVILYRLLATEEELNQLNSRYEVNGKIDSDTIEIKLQ